MQLFFSFLFFKPNSSNCAYLRVMKRDFFGTSRDGIFNNSNEPPPLGSLSETVLLLGSIFYPAIASLVQSCPPISPNPI